MTKSVHQTYADKLRELTIEASTASAASSYAYDAVEQAEQVLRDAKNTWQAACGRVQAIDQELRSIKASMRELLDEY